MACLHLIGNVSEQAGPTQREHRLKVLPMDHGASSRWLVDCAQIWHMSLDNTRNRTLQTNLTISIGSLALTMAMLPAAIFGMNLHSGWEVRLRDMLNVKISLKSAITEFAHTTRSSDGCLHCFRASQGTKSVPAMDITLFWYLLYDTATL